MATQIHGLEPALRRMRAIGNDKTVKRIARKAMRQAMNIARDAARQKVKRLDDPTTPEKSGKKLWFKMAGVEIKTLWLCAWECVVAHVSHIQTTLKIDVLGVLVKLTKRTDESFTGDSLS